MRALDQLRAFERMDTVERLEVTSEIMKEIIEEQMLDDQPFIRIRRAP